MTDHDDNFSVDSVNIDDFDALHIQAEKIKAADLFQAFEEINDSRMYHKLAYRYQLDNMIDLMAVYYELVSDLTKKTVAFAKRLQFQILPPFIEARINAIMANELEIDPNMPMEKRTRILDALFEPGSEFDGLFLHDETGKPYVDEKWLQEYIEKSEAADMPIRINIQVTEEMAKDMDEIDKMSISAEEKEQKLAELFDDGGKYDGALEASYNSQLESFEKKQK